MELLPSELLLLLGRICDTNSRYFLRKVNKFTYNVFRQLSTERISIVDAATEGYLNQLRYAVALQYTMTTLTFYRACEEGHLDIIKYFVQDLSRIFDVRAWELVLSKDHLDCVKFASTLPRVDKFWGRGAAKFGTYASVESNNIECWELVLSKMKPKTYPRILRFAAAKGNMKIVKYLTRSHWSVPGLFGDVNIMPNAVSSNNYEIVKYLFDIGIKVDRKHIGYSIVNSTDARILELLWNNV